MSDEKFSLFEKLGSHAVVEIENPRLNIDLAERRSRFQAKKQVVTFSAKIQAKQSDECCECTPIVFENTNFDITITNAIGSGTDVVYTANNTFVVGQVVNITGVNPIAYNLPNVVITAATPTTFTVASSAVGLYVSGGIATFTTSNPFVISQPGVYKLSTTSVYFPSAEVSAAIVVLSDNVVIDLCDHTLSQGNFVSDTYGVLLGEGLGYSDPDFVLENVTVQNGTIRDFTAVGIFAYNASYDGPTAMIPFQDLFFYDLNILNCGTLAVLDYFGNGINFDSADPENNTYLAPAYKNVIVRKCNINHCKGAAGIQIYTVDGLIVEKTQVNDFQSFRPGFVVGPFVITGINVAIREVEANRHLSKLTSSVSSVNVNFSRNVILENVQANNLAVNQGLANTSTFAFRLQTTINVTIANCQGNFTTVTDVAVLGQCGGINIGSSFNVTIKDSQFNNTFGESSVIVNNNLSTTTNLFVENCQFNNTRGGARVPLVAGVHNSDIVGSNVRGNGNKFINCQFNGSSVAAPLDPAGNAFLCGFFSVTVTNTIFEQCQFSNIASNSPGVSGFGLIFATDPNDVQFTFGEVNNTVIDQCVISDIIGTRSAIGIAIPGSAGNRTGRQSQSSNVVVKNCVVERISSLTNVITDVIAGIAVYDIFQQSVVLRQNTVQRNFFASHNRVADVHASTNFANSAGIFIRSVIRPTLVENNVSDCDRGILLTGSDLISPANGFQLASTLSNATTFPPLPVNLTSIPASSPSQIFTNLTRGNSITIAPSTTTIDLQREFILALVDLNTLGWQVGDQILYDANGGVNIGGLVSGTTYFLIVYIPGFSTRGVIDQNYVSNNLVSGYEDTSPRTTSAWTSNKAFCNGVEGKANYVINWGKCAPVAKGNLTRYPCPKSYIENVSISCGDCDCRK